MIILVFAINAEEPKIVNITGDVLNISGDDVF